MPRQTGMRLQFILPETGSASASRSAAGLRRSGVPALRFALGLLVTAWLSVSAWAQSPTNFDASHSDFVNSFKGLGALEDGSKVPTPEETIRRFQLAPGLEAQVVAHEPTITQPLNLHFDERGRIWIV